MRSRRRTLLIVAGIAVGALAAGVFAGTRITSPADAAARAAPPEATDVTVQVEFRELQSTVVMRGDASFTGAVDVQPELSGLETTPVVTGQVPDVGEEIEAGDVLIEIAGRPVLALPGDIPMYRSLRPGVSGPDVEQLEKALEKLGFDPGTVDDSYTNATGRAVAELFDKAGYPPPSVDPDIQTELDQAEDAVRMAEDEVSSAESALQAVSTGPSDAEKIAAQNDVDQAERALARAREEKDNDQIADAEAQLALAKANQRDLLDGPDTSAERSALEAARTRLHDAVDQRDAVAARAGTPLPAAEVMFVPSLPRRVDDVNVDRGGVVDGTVMSVSGADLVVTAHVDAAGREFLEKEMEAVLDLPTGEQISALITDLRESPDDGYDVTLTPEDLTADQVEALRSANVRVTVPIANTSGEVLAVPLAALTAGPSGEARVEVQRTEDEEITTQLVEVEVGLTADGYAEVVPVQGSLEEGDLVVVGRA